MKKVISFILVSILTLTVISIAVPAFAAEAIADGTMVYFEDFNGYTNTTTSADTAAQAGFTVLNKSEGTAITDNTALWLIEDGRLHIDNFISVSGGTDSFLLVVPDSKMSEINDTCNYTIQYDLTLMAGVNTSRYIAVPFHYSLSTYGDYDMCNVSLAGFGANQNRFVGKYTSYNVAGDYNGVDLDDLDGTTSLCKKITGKDYNKDVMALQGISLTVRIQVPLQDGENFPNIYIRNNAVDAPSNEFILVSKGSAEGSAGKYYKSSTMPDANICLFAGGQVEAYVDNFMVYTGLGDEPADKTVTYTPPSEETTTEATTEEETTEGSVSTTAEETTKENDPIVTNDNTEASTSSSTDTGNEPTGCGSSASGIAVILAVTMFGVTIIKKDKKE